MGLGRISGRIARLAGASALTLSTFVGLTVVAAPSAHAATCTKTWANATTGDWNVAGNWAPIGVPGSADDVCITPVGTYTVSISNVSPTVHSLTLGTPSLTNGTQSLVLDSANLSLSLTAASTVDVSGALTLGDASTSNAFLQETTSSLTNNGVLSSAGSGTAWVRANVVNNGTVNLGTATTNTDSSGGATTVTNNATVTVASGTTWTVSGGSGIVNSAGSMAVTGTVVVSGGTFTQRAGTTSGNAVQLASGATLDDDTTAGAGSWLVTGNDTVTGTGSSPGVASGQTVTVASSNIQLTMAKSLVNDGTITLGNASTSNAFLTSGASTLTNNGVLSSAGGGTAWVRANVVNNGAVDLGTVNTITDSSGGATTLTNNSPAATLSVASGAEWGVSGGSGIVNSAGSMAVTGALVQSGGTFTQRAGTTSGNAVQLSSDATLDDDTTGGAGSWLVTGNDTLTGTGASPGVASGQTVTVASSNIQLTMAKSLVNDGTITLGNVSTSNAFLTSGTSVLTNNGVLSSAGGGTAWLRANVVNNGAVNLGTANTDTDSSGGATTLTNNNVAATVTVASGATWTVSGGSGIVNSAGSMVVSGTLVVSGGTFTQRAGTTSGNAVQLASGATLDDDTTAGAGSWLVTGNDTLTGTGASPGVASGQTVTVASTNISLNMAKSLANNGTITLGDPTNTSNAILTSGAFVLTNGGTLASAGKGTALLRANVVNNGAVTLGTAVTTTDGSGGVTTLTNNSPAATVTVASGAAWTVSGGSGIVNSAGSIAVTAPTGALTVSGGTFTERAGTTSGNAVQLSSGATLDDDTGGGAGSWLVTGNDTLTGTGASPGVALGQTVTVASSNIQLTMAKSLVNNGTITLGNASTSNAFLTSGTSVLTNDGTVSTAGSGTAWLRANVANNGTVSFGISTNTDGSGGATTFTNNNTVQIASTATWTIGGGSAYTQAVSGILQTTIDATAGHNSLISGGVDTLAGTLDVTTVGAPSGTHSLVSGATSVTGKFSTLNYGTQDYLTTYPGAGVNLTVPNGYSFANLGLSSYGAGVSPVTYTVTSNGPALTSGGTFTVAGPTGTVFPISGCGVYVVTDTTTSVTNSCVSVIGGGTNSVTITTPFTTNPGDTVILAIHGSTNINSTAPQTLTITNGVNVLPLGFQLFTPIAPAITSGNAATFTVGTAGSFTVTATGTITRISEAGVLPTGVTFVDNGNGTATLAGTPAVATGAVYAITITAHNGVNPDATQSFTLTVDEAAAITSPASATFTVGSAGTLTVVATGFPVPTISEAGALPSGVTFVGGVLSGTPAAGTSGIYPLTITAHNGVGADATQSFTLTVDQAPAITSANSASFVAGVGGSFTVTATGFPTAALSEAGALPSGVTFLDNSNGTATISVATSASASVTPLTITGANGVTPNATQSFTLTISAVNVAPTITSAASTTFVVGSAGTFTVVATGSPVPTLSETGVLPTGVTFVGGVLAGTPAAGTGGSYALTITAANGILPNATQSFTLTVDQAPAITSANSASFVAGTGGSFTVTSSGFPTAALSEAGALPSGVTFLDNGNGTATISVATSASASVTPMTITGANGVTPNATQSFTLTISTPTSAPTITSASSTTFTVGSAGTFTVVATGSPAPTLSEAGVLPTGVTFVGGVLAGTPAAATGGTYPITITAANGILPNATQSFTLTVDQAPAITSANSASFVAGVGGSFTVTATGFPVPTFLEAAPAPFPTGVTFHDNGNGTLTITVAATVAVGTYPVSIGATNGVAPDAGQAFTLTITTPTSPPAITSAGATTFSVGSAGSFAVTATGSPAPTLSEAGMLPTGVSFVGGVLSGTPAAATGGTYPITITAANGILPNATQSFTLTVDQAPAITSIPTTVLTVGLAGSFTVTTSGFPAAAITESGALPAGVTLHDNGNGTATLAGVPAAGTAGPHLLTLAAANGVPPAASQLFQLTIAPAASGPTIDSKVSVQGNSPLPATLTTTVPGDLIVAFVAADGPGATAQTATVSGGGLTWTLVGRTNTQAGTAEVWSARATGTLSGAVISALSSGGTYMETMTVIAFNGAAGTGAVTKANARTGAPSATLTTTGANSWVYGVGFDWDRAVGRTVGANQTLVNQATDAAGDTYWVQSQTALTPASGTAVTINDTAPTTDRWNLTEVEILAGSRVTVAPAITSASNATFNAGTGGTFTVTTAGSPAPAITETGALPSGVSFHDNANGTATITVAATATPAVTPITITAANGTLPNATQSFTLTVKGAAPAITSAAAATLFAGTGGTFTVTTTGSPAPAITETGALPSGVSFHDNANGTATITVAATATAAVTPITITAANGTLPNATQAFTLTVSAPSAGPRIDAKVTASGTSPQSVSLTTPTAGDLVVAFVAGDGPASATQTATVTGGGLTWTLAGRTNAQFGTAEVWWARATGTLSATSITSTLGSPGYMESLTVIAFANAGGIGAVTKTSAATGAPAATLTTTAPNSWVFAVGDDWSRAVARTAGAGQTVQNQVFDTAGDTFWVQSQLATTPAAAALVTINDTAPTNDRWNLTEVEILGATGPGSGTGGGG